VCFGACSFLFKGTPMPITQIERLKNDLNELEAYASKLIAKGKKMEAKNILKKREFMVKTLKSNGVQLST